MLRSVVFQDIFLLSLLLSSQYRIVAGLVHGHKHSHSHFKRHAHASTVSHVDDTSQELEVPVEKRPEGGLALLNGRPGRSHNGPFEFLEDLKDLSEEIEDGFRDLRELLAQILEVNKVMKKQIVSLRESLHPSTAPSSRSSTRYRTTTTVRVSRTATVWATVTSPTVPLTTSAPYPMPTNSSTSTWHTEAAGYALDRKSVV